MTEQLRSAGERLRAALDHYISVCSDMQHCNPNGLPSCLSSIELSHQLDDELAFFPSYDTGIQRAKRAISEVRNYTSLLVPISKLPPEIMTRIFYMILAKPCYLRFLPVCRSVESLDHHAYLLHVCSRWRHILLSDSLLWAHIDLAPGHSKSMVSRAISQAEWTNCALPLDIHITDADMKEYDDDDDELFQFLDLVADRMKTLEFDVTADDWDLFHSAVLEALLTYCSSNFTKLVLRSRDGYSNTFITGLGDSNGESDYPQRPRRGSLLHIPREKFEESVASLTVLHLDGIFPLCGSKAYHGLVDLRLASSDYDWSLMKEQDLKAILKASPQLRILHLALHFTNPFSELKDTNPVHLKDLEVVSLSTNSDSEPEYSVPQLTRMLRLVAPGSRPLRLSLQTISFDQPLLAELDRFLSRSNIERLCTRGACLPMGELPRYAARLKVLVFDSCTYESHHDSPSDYDTSPVSASLSHLHSWHIHNSQIDLRNLRSMVDLYPNGTIALSECRFTDKDGRQVDLSETELSTSFPTLEFIPDSNPTADWDSLP